MCAGVDEAGRGALAGPVCAAAVILPPALSIPGLADSKTLSAVARRRLATQIRRHARCHALGWASVAEIERLNILHASMLAMWRAVARLQPQPAFVEVDGNRCPAWRYPSRAVVKGDAKIPAISAASILAKVARDRLMGYYQRSWPEYRFARHKGYPTAYHLRALTRHGACPAHRRLFSPVRRVIGV